MMNKLLFNGYTMYQGKIVFKEHSSGLLCELDVNTGIIKYIEDLKSYQVEFVNFDCMNEHKGKLYALTSDGKSIMIYDNVQNTCDWMSINCGIRQWGNFTNMFALEDTLFIFHRAENMVTCCNIFSAKIEQIQSNVCSKNICSCRIGNKVWIFPREGNQIQEFDLETRKYDCHEINCELETIISCTYDKDNIYLLNDYGKIYVIGQKDFYLDVMDFEVKEDISNMMGKIICVANNLILLPSAGEDIKIIDLDKKKMDVFWEYPDDFVYDDIAWSKYYSVCEDGDYFYLLRKSNYLLKIKKDSGQLVWTKLTPTDEAIKEKMLFRYKYVKDIIWEGNLSLNMFAKNIPIMEDASDKNRAIGSEIWKKI